MMTVNMPAGEGEDAPKQGRPTVYTPELAHALCERIAGGESLRTICSDPAMPGKTTVFRWLADKDRTDFRDHYARAREAQAEFLAEEILEIADETAGDYVQSMVGDEVVERVDHEHIARSRLRVDARKWFAGKVAPKKYGDRIHAEHSGPNGEPLPESRTVIVLPHNGRDVPVSNPAGAGGVAQPEPNGNDGDRPSAGTTNSVPE